MYITFLEHDFVITYNYVKINKLPILLHLLCLSAVSEVTDQHKTVAKKRVYKRRIQPKGADAAPERIRDMTVTKKTYAKWKPLSSSTKKYTKQVLESAIL